jgi:hypothetical protein
MIKFLHSTGTVAGNDWGYIADHVLYSKSYQRMLASMKKKVRNVSSDAAINIVFQRGNHFFFM